MPATLAPTTRTLSVLWDACPTDTRIVAVRIDDCGKRDLYHAFHAADSCEVEWVHDDQPTRSYRVVCGAGSRLPTACDCKGWQYGKGKHCRHMAATKVLIDRGYVELPRLTDAGHDRGGCE